MNHAAAAAHARRNAKPASTGMCARHVRLALMEGGGLDLVGWPGHALQYHTLGYLKANGFREVPKAGYVPEVGDIAVSEAPQGVPNRESGHIAIWDGRSWVSDFVQLSHLGNSAWLGKVPHWYYRYGGRERA